MNILVIIVAIISIFLVFLTRYYGLSVIYPTLTIVLAIILDILANTLARRKEKKENTNLKEILMRKQK